MNDIRRGANRATEEIDSTREPNDKFLLRSAEAQKLENDSATGSQLNNLSISFRAALSGIRVSFIDATPSEVFLASLVNVNAIGSYDALHRTESTFYLTVSELQIDNMIPNAPFLVAVSRAESSRSSERVQAEDSKPPLLVIGLSLAPKHESGVVVSELVVTGTHLTVIL